MREVKFPGPALIDEEVKVVWAALMAMTLDIHTPQDNLSEAEWAIAERLTSEFTSMMDDEPSDARR